MSEFIAVMNMSGDNITSSEHTTSRVMAGDAESVRGRLVYALENLGYKVVSENPLQARRAQLKDIVRADFTDHARKLAVGLRQGGAAATQVTFDFVVSHGGFVTKGDMLTLEREADAVVALAVEPTATGPCRSCGTENGGDARFCRLCGAPCAAGMPAEVELLRLTAAARGSLQEIVCGLGIALIALACLLPLIIWGKPKAVNAGWILLAIGQIIGWWMALYGIMRVHRALRRKPEGLALPAAAAAPSQFAPARAASLPPAYVSVTEGTTELLSPTPREREKVPARREHSDTGPIG